MALLAIAALAIGIGAATAIYSVVQAVLLNPLGYPDQERFLAVWNGFIERPGWKSAFSYPNALDVAARVRTLDAFGCLKTASFNVTFNHQVSREVGVEVSPALVHAIGVEPVLGRWFANRDIAGTERETSSAYSAVIAASLWKRSEYHRPIPQRERETLHHSGCHAGMVSPSRGRSFQ